MTGVCCTAPRPTEGAAGEASQYRLDKGEWEHIEPPRRFRSGVASFKVTDLYEGRHTVELNSTDRAGNVGEVAEVTWVVDEGPPKVRFVETPEKHSHRRAAVFHVQAGEGDCSYEYRVLHAAPPL